jgi:CRISPR-associated protein Cas2
MMIMFDLPVVEKEDRKRATGFRNHLLDEGFRMAQYSIYYRMLDGKEAADAMERRIEKMIPPNGSVHILNITDKQYGNLRVYEQKSRKHTEKPDQLVLF